jgi:hypothetical protein
MLLRADTAHVKMTTMDLTGTSLSWAESLRGCTHSCKFRSGTGRNGRNASYRHLDRHRRASVPFRVKYRSIPGNTGHSGQFRPKRLFRLFRYRTWHSLASTRAAVARLPDSTNLLRGPAKVWLTGWRMGWDPDCLTHDAWISTRLVALSSTYV